MCRYSLRKKLDLLKNYIVKVNLKTVFPIICEARVNEKVFIKSQLKHLTQDEEFDEKPTPI